MTTAAASCVRYGLILLALAAAATKSSSRAAEPSAAPPPVSSASITDGSDAARTYFPDVILIDQRGKPLHFHSDLLEGRVVVIGAVSTNCDEHCARSLATWTEVEKKLGKRMGSEVRFLSLASDPVRDSEERMRGLAKTFGAGKGWYFLTGPPASLNLVLAKLDMRPQEGGAPASTWVVANVKSGLYKLGPDTMSVDQLLDVVEECLSDR